MHRNISITEPIIQTQLNIEKNKSENKPNFIDFLQRSIANERSKDMPEDVRECPVCGQKISRADMYFTRDCHGITYRLVCWKCYDKLMAKGYDGAYYTEADECLDFDY